MSKLKIGDTAPEINSVDQNNESITLEQFKGKKVVLYFYPKDMTPGCTVQSCNLKDNYKVLLIIWILLFIELYFSTPILLLFFRLERS